MVNMTDRFENSSEWAASVDGCVFDCGASLRIQHELQYARVRERELEAEGEDSGEEDEGSAAKEAEEAEEAKEAPRPLGWHTSKCRPRLFGCGDRGWCEEVVNQTDCKPPLGSGEIACSVNDLHCGTKCLPPWLFNASNQSSTAEDAQNQSSGSWADMFS